MGKGGKVALIEVSRNEAFHSLPGLNLKNLNRKSPMIKNLSIFLLSIIPHY
jgi:hypothetical protein